uniref:Uncharacterized protein n=1 Tax=Anguilla anguilla TaxID=7936 RepID=A0A0E9RJN8_ANGAN
MEVCLYCMFISMCSHLRTLVGTLFTRTPSPTGPDLFLEKYSIFFAVVINIGEGRLETVSSLVFTE